MSRLPLRRLARKKSPFIRGLTSKNLAIISVVSGPAASPEKPVSSPIETRATKVDVYEYFIPDIGGVFFPPESDFP